MGNNDLETIWDMETRLTKSDFSMVGFICFFSFVAVLAIKQICNSSPVFLIVNFVKKLKEGVETRHSIYSVFVVLRSLKKYRKYRSL